MLKTRILTSIVGLCLFVLVLWWKEPLGVFALLGVVALFALDEWANLTAQPWWVKVLSGLGLIGFALLILNHTGVWFFWLLCLTMLLWLFWVTQLHCARHNLNLLPKTSNAQDMLQGFVMVNVAFLALIIAANHDSLFLVYVMSIVWVMDIAAYFVGRALGKNKLASAISPGKSIEGAAGALVVLAVYAVIMHAVLDVPIPLLGFVLVTMFAGAISIYGDLYISALKRKAGVKDSGWVLPGHGGVLDRFDSLLAAAPTFIFLFYLTQSA